ncbi:MAG: hypothetical protein AB7O71_14200 [Hyphomicrobiaceae bacterium]
MAQIIVFSIKNNNSFELHGHCQWQDKSSETDRLGTLISFAHIGLLETITCSILPADTHEVINRPLKHTGVFVMFMRFCVQGFFPATIQLIAREMMTFQAANVTFEAASMTFEAVSMTSQAALRS